MFETMLEYTYIISFILLALSIVLQLSAAVLLWVDLRSNSNRLSNGVLFILNINIGMQVTIPNIIGFFNNYEIEREINIRIDDLLLTTLVHAIYIMCFLVAFKYKLIPDSEEKIKIDEIDKLQKSNYQNKIEINDKVVLVVLALGYYILWNNFNPSPIEGSVNTDVVIYATTMFEWSAILASIVIVALYKGKFLYKFLAAILFLGFQIYFISKGLRGGVLIFIILFPFYLYIKNGKINFKLVAIGIMVVVPIFPYLGGDFREQLATTLFNATPTERLESLFKESDAIGDKSSVQSAIDGLEKIYQRLEATRNSVSLINLYNNGEGVLFRPTISSLAAFFPTRLWPSKNYPSSSTEDVNGTAMYVVRSVTYGLTDMGPFLSSAHDYWEGGIFYVIISAVLTGLIWRKICDFGCKNGYSSLSLLIIGSLLDAHHGEISVTSPLALVIKVIFFQIVPLVILYLVIDFLLKIKLSTSKDA